MLFREYEMLLVFEDFFVKTDNHNAFTMLWHISLTIHYLVINRVVQFFKSFTNDSERIAIVMGCQVLNIFKIKSLRSVTTYYICNIKKQSPLSFILKSRFTSKTIFLRNTCY